MSSPARHCRDLMVVLGILAALGCPRRENPPPAKVAKPLTAELVEQNNRGVGLMGHFDFEQAHSVFSELVAERPTWAEVDVNLAIATLNRQREGDLAAAQEILEQVLEHEPGNLRARYCLGILELYGSAPQDAIHAFHAVADADPRDAYAAYYTGQCLFEEGKYDEALKWYHQALERDPYLRSAYYGSFQALQRLKRGEQAQQMLHDFERLKDNPQARLAEFKYSRMGPKAAAATVDLDPRPKAKLPDGPVFGKSKSLLAEPVENLKWTAPESGNADAVWPSATVNDIDGDGQLDTFLAASRQAGDSLDNTVLLAGKDGWRIASDHPLAGVTNMRAALWGDYDNDGLTDVYLCRRGPNQLWRQIAKGKWENVTEATDTAGGDFDTIDGAFADLDHDGDLDLLLVRADGPTELLNNNLDGSFRPLAAEHGLAGDSRPARGVLVADIDSDRDADVIIIKQSPPHEVFRNDRLWKYAAADGFDAFRRAEILAAVAADADADGQVELYTLSPEGLSRWRPDKQDEWQAKLIVPGGLAADARPQLAIADVDGDGRLDALFTSGDHVQAVRLDGKFEPLTTVPIAASAAWTLANFDPAAGPALITVGDSGGPQLVSPGSGRFPFTSLTLSGKHDKADQMRSNASGIGVRLAARADSRWTAVGTYRASSGPGQSLQPVAIGLGGQQAIDFVSIDWTDGIYQTELELKGGGPRRIVETQRQTSSCPVVFVWNGSEYEFITDILGVGGLGFAIGPDSYAPVRPRENLLLPVGRPIAEAGRLRLKIAEPMEELCYLDSVALAAYDLPPGWQMTLDERMATGEPEATGRPVFYRQMMLPQSAHNGSGQDVTHLVTAADRQAAGPTTLDPRFVGRAGNHDLTLEFAEPIPLDGSTHLLADGWLEYPYSQTMFAAWQAGATYDPPTLEARDSSGEWHVLAPQFGYPAGMPRQMLLPLPDAGFSTTALRLRTTLEVYWDQLAVIRGEPCPEARAVFCPLVSAELSFAGFPRRTNGAQRQPAYEYGRRDPLWDTRYQRGWYTAFGPVEPLVNACDSAVVVFGPGEELSAEFDAPAHASPPGWTRRYVLETTGWCKDMDLYTRDGETVAPLPVHEHATPEELDDRNQLHELYHTRYQSGR